jgi:hypothetical protein
MDKNIFKIKPENHEFEPDGIIGHVDTDRDNSPTPIASKVNIFTPNAQQRKVSVDEGKNMKISAEFG